MNGINFPSVFELNIMNKGKKYWFLCQVKTGNRRKQQAQRGLKFINMPDSTEEAGFPSTASCQQSAMSTHTPVSRGNTPKTAAKHLISCLPDSVLGENLLSLFLFSFFIN